MLPEIFEEGICWQLILICSFFGILGQAARMTIGFYKLIMDAKRPFFEFFDWKKLIISFVLGALIGAICSLIYKFPLSGPDILGVIASSYAGSDWLEGFLTKKAN